jgi:hypothetical protein
MPPQAIDQTQSTVDISKLVAEIENLFGDYALDASDFICINPPNFNILETLVNEDRPLKLKFKIKIPTRDGCSAGDYGDLLITAPGKSEMSVDFSYPSDSISSFSCVIPHFFAECGVACADHSDKIVVELGPEGSQLAYRLFAMITGDLSNYVFKSVEV